jgi:uncharacterized protein (TIGR02147 family)
MKPRGQLPSIYAYEDFRQFLGDFYRAYRAVNKGFSHRFISSQLGFASSSWFADLLKGRMNLAGGHLVKLAVLLRLKDREADYFESLVLYNQATSAEEKTHHFRKLLTFKELRTDTVGREKFVFYNQWYYATLRELLFFYDFRGDYASLAKKLCPPIQVRQAREAVRLLLELDFIYKDAQGCFRPRAITLKKDSTSKSVHAAAYLTENIALGAQALDRFEKEERHVSALTLSYSTTGYKQALAEIEQLRKRLVALMEKDPEPNAVYQFNIQFFPQSR